ncbi:MAG: hypothetical protein WBN65_12585 [Gammaproteobacteria bacterium]
MSSRSFEQDIVLDLGSRLPGRVAGWIIAAGLLNVLLSTIDPALKLGLAVICVAAWVQAGSRRTRQIQRATWSLQAGWRLWQEPGSCESVALEDSRRLPGLGVVLTWRRIDGRRERRMIIPRQAGAADCRRLRVRLRFDPDALHG